MAGLLLTLPAASARLAALSGVILQSRVGFPLHIPPVAALFVVLAASGGGSRRSDRTQPIDEGEPEENGKAPPAPTPSAQPAA